MILECLNSKLQKSYLVLLNEETNKNIAKELKKKQIPFDQRRLDTQIKKTTIKMIDSARSTFRLKPQPFIGYSTQNSVQLCTQCGLQFQSVPQLLNHRRKFCQNSGYDNLTGLLMKQTGRNDLKIDYKMKNEKKILKKDNQAKMKNYGQYSLSKIQPIDEDPIGKKSNQLYKDMMGIQKHRNQLQSVRHYGYDSKMYGSATKNVNMQTLDTRLENKKNNTLSNSKSVSSFSYRLDEEGFGKNQKNNALQLQNLLLKNQQSISPATINLKRSNYQKSMAKKSFADQNVVKYTTNPISQQFKLRQLSQYPSILHKSDASIENMSQQQKITYAQYKLDELRQIKLLYFENEGQSKEFKKNIESMITFYEKLLNDCKTNELRESGLSIASRPDTPIMKLNEETQNKVKKQNKKKDQINKPNQIEPISNQFSYGYPPYPMNMDPNFLMTQNYAQLYYAKMMQEMLKSKSEENKKLIEALIQVKKKQKDPQSDKKTENDNDKEEKYRFSNGVDATTPSEDRILKLLQQEQLDELKLISKLPVNLQDEKLQSIIKNSQLRFQMEKEVLKQKLQRLSWQQKMQSFEQERQIQNNDWVGVRNKDIITSQMNHYLDNFQQEFRPINKK